MKLPLHYLRTAKYYLRGKWRAANLPAGVVANARGTVVLAYHGIDYANDTSVNTKFRGQKYFEEEIKLLSQFANIVSLDDYVNDNIDPRKLNVAITFDDGFLNNYQIARPVLEKYNAPATFFVTPTWQQGKDILWPDLVDHTLPYAPAILKVREEVYSKDVFGRYFHSSGLPIRQHIIRQNRSFLDELYLVLMPLARFKANAAIDIYWKLMGEKHLAELAANPLFTIGAHSCTHTNLCYIGDKEALDELGESKRILESVIQKEVSYFAAPFGAYNDRTIGLTKNAGYKYNALAHLFDVKHEQDAGIIPRFVTNPYLSPAHQLLFIANKKY